MSVCLMLAAALASVVGSPSSDALARPKVESRGAFVCRGDELSLTATRLGCPFNLLWPQNLASGAVYRVSYEMKADVADGFGGLFAVWHDPVPRADGLRYDVWRETHEWGCTNGSGKLFALYDDSWRLSGGLPLRTTWTGYSFLLRPSERMERPLLVFSARSAVTNVVHYRACRVEKVGQSRNLLWRNMLFETRDGEARLRPAAATRVEADVVGAPGEFHRVAFEITNEEAPGALRTFDAALSDGAQTLDEYVSESSLGGTWLRKTLEARMPASGRMTLSLFVYNGDTHAPSAPSSTVLRNVSVSSFTPKPAPKVEISLSEPVYKRTVYATSPKRNIAGVVRARGGDEVRVSLVEAASGRILSTTETRGAFELPATDALTPGSFSVTAETAAGASATVGVRRVAASPSEVSYRDGRMRVNGRPYFFSGVWGPPQYHTEAMYYGHARNGLRVQLWGASPRTSEQLLKDLDLAAKYHSKLIPDVQFSPGRFHEKGYFDQWKKDVQRYFSPQVRAHPALLGYYMCDEPGFGGVSLVALEAAYRTIDELDPYHPAWINEAPITSLKRLRRSLGACDAYGVDIYPVPASHAHSGLPDKEVTSVGGFARLFADLLAGTRPTWLVLQGTSWDSIAEKPNPVYPTREQTRFMSLDAMVNGASGTIYWGMWYTRGRKNGPGNAPFYEGMLAAAREVRALDALWTVGDTLALPRVEGLMTFAAEIEGERWIVALNRTSRPLACAFALDGLWVLPEGRKAVPGDACLPGYTAHVFASVPRYPKPHESEIPFDPALEQAFRRELDSFLTE